MKPLSTRKKLLFAALTLGLSLGGLELLARAYFVLQSSRAGPPDDAAVIHRFHPLRYELAPGGTIPANGAVARINSLGLRGPEPRSTGDRRRILCLGDSCTFGYGPDVRDEATYPARLGRDLDRDRPGRFDVLNGGMPSFCTLDCLNFYLYRGVEFRPSVVVIMAGWNDSHLCHDLDSPPPRAWPTLRESSALIRLGTRVAARFVGERRVGIDSQRAQLRLLPTPTDRLSDAAFDRNRRLLDDLVRAVRDHGSRPILVTLPNFTRPDWTTDIDSLSDEELGIMVPHLAGGNLSPRGWFRFASRTNAAIEVVARERGVPLVDGASIRDPKLFVDLCHLNAAGNAALAAKVEAALLADEPSR